jgi:hypothetical protein
VRSTVELSLLLRLKVHIFFDLGVLIFVVRDAFHGEVLAFLQTTATVFNAIVEQLLAFCRALPSWRVVHPSFA